MFLMSPIFSFHSSRSRCHTCGAVIIWNWAGIVLQLIQWYRYYTVHVSLRNGFRYGQLKLGKKFLFFLSQLEISVRVDMKSECNQKPEVRPPCSQPVWTSMTYMTPTLFSVADARYNSKHEFERSFNLRGKKTPLIDSDVPLRKPWIPP